jgi:hypothetical protein
MYFLFYVEFSMYLRQTKKKPQILENSSNSEIYQKIVRFFSLLHSHHAHPPTACRCTIMDSRSWFSSLPCVPAMVPGIIKFHKHSHVPDKTHTYTHKHTHTHTHHSAKEHPVARQRQFWLVRRSTAALSALVASLCLRCVAVPHGPRYGFNYFLPYDFGASRPRQFSVERELSENAGGD